MAADQAGEMSPLEILIQHLFVIVAGSDTTRGALAVQTAQLLQHREQWEAVSRFVLEDIELGGYVLNAGQFMTLSTMSAMRDEKVFEAPDTFDIFRTDGQRWHLVFGGGCPSMPR